MGKPRTRGAKSTTAVGAKAPAASASAATARITDDQTAADLEDGVARDDGSDMMVRAGDPTAATRIGDGGDLEIQTSEGSEEGGLIEESGSAFAWSVPDSTPRLRRAALELDTTTSTAPFVAGLDIVATDAPSSILRPAANAETRVISIRKHRSGETVQATPPPAIATQTSIPEGDVAAPEFMRPRFQADAADREAFAPRRQAEGVDPLTQRLGCRWFTDAARFDWCREGRFNLNPTSELDSRPRHVFTRWYQMDRIIVDVFRSDSDRVRHEIAEKIESIRAQAIVEGRPIGYLPCIRGAFVPDEVIRAVKRGEIAPLQLAQMRTDPVVAAFG